MTDFARLREARARVARLVAVDEVYLPIFARLEEEVVRAEAAADGDATERARALLNRQRATA